MQFGVKNNKNKFKYKDSSYLTQDLLQKTVDTV